MGLTDTIRQALSVAVAKSGVLDQPRTPVVYDTPATSDVILGLDPDAMWRAQPYLRTVVTFMARNIAQLGLQTFQRVSETDRVRDRTHPAALLLARPNSGTTAYELVYGLVADLALYDRAYWLLAADADAPSGYSLTRVPAPWVVMTRGGGLFEPAEYGIQRPTTGGTVWVPAENILAFHGWSPDSLRSGSSPVETLKQILAEQIEAQAYRLQVWRRGGRISSVLTRPAGVSWSDTARDRFMAAWRSRWTADNDAGSSGSAAGGTPILEDGMTLQKLGFSAHEDEVIEMAKLALTVVASVYHVNPTMIGLLDSANYSNVREFRRMLYGDTLGPVLAQIEDRLNTFLLPRLGGPADRYVEFNIGEKLQGSFEEQATAMQSSTGAPWMTRNEARARLNLPAIAGADALVVPLNVLVGGQASPTDSGSQNLAHRRPQLVKARAASTYDAKHTEVLTAFFDRQGRVVKTALGVKAADDWWDSARWDRELAADLLALASTTSESVAAQVLEALGFTADDYNPGQALPFLKAFADRVAAAVNVTTKDQLDHARTDDDQASAIAAVFEFAAGARAAQLAVTLVTAMSGFGTVEAAKQVGGGKAEKTWVTGHNPRKSHSAMGGQTVPVDEPFSNGAMWPGDGPDADEAAGCNCHIEITIPD